MHRSGENAAGDVGPIGRKQKAVNAHQRERPMAEPARDGQFSGPVDCCSARGDPIVELTLLMPHPQMEALELMAFRGGETTAHLLRRLIRNWLAGFGGARPPEEPALPN